jgi:hypothetical protein
MEVSEMMLKFLGSPCIGCDKKIFTLDLAKVNISHGIT